VCTKEICVCLSLSKCVEFYNPVKNSFKIELYGVGIFRPSQLSATTIEDKKCDLKTNRLFKKIDKRFHWQLARKRVLGQILQKFQVSKCGQFPWRCIILNFLEAPLDFLYHFWLLRYGFDSRIFLFSFAGSTTALWKEKLFEYWKK